MQAFLISNGGVTGLPDTVMLPETRGGTIDIPYYTVLIKHPEGNVLFDCGGNDDPSRVHERCMKGLHLTEEEKFPACLEALGLTPDDIDYVVVSHLHGDHMGYVDLFKSSKIYASAKSFEGSCKDVGANEGLYVNDFQAVLDADLHWQLIPERVEKVELLDGLTIYNLGSGHHYGMIGLLVELPEYGNIFLASDACNYLESLADPPLLPPLRSHDYEGSVATLGKIKKIAADNNAEVWPGHDLVWFESMKKSTEGYFS